LPLWRNFICLPDTNINKKQYFIDHELFLNCKEKDFSGAEQKNLKEKFLEIETENFLLIFKILYLADFTFLPNVNKPKPKAININKFKRERFLSEGTCEETVPDKNEVTPLRFFAQWGTEGDISQKKLPNHFKIQQTKSEIMSIWVKGSENKDEIEVIDSEPDVNIRTKDFLNEEEENNQFELITEETELEKKLEVKKQNSDYQIIGKEKNFETLEKISEKCNELIGKIMNFDKEVSVFENIAKLKAFARSLD